MLKAALSYLDKIIQRNMSTSSHHHVVVGAIALVGFPLFYWLWTDWYPQSHEYESIHLRLIASLLGFGLMLTPFWPKSISRLIPWFWFFTLLYAFSFLFPYFFLMNRADDVSSMSLLCSVFLLVLLVDVYNLILLLALGFSVAFLSYYLMTPELYFSQEHIEVGLLALFFIIAGSTVRYKTALVEKQRMKGMAAAAGMIAHELRTPLLGVKSGTQVLEAFLPTLFDAYKLAKENGLLRERLRANRFKQLEGVNERIIREINYANTIIDMLLMKAGKDNSLKNCPLEPCSMAECLNEALLRYPFRSSQSRDLVECEGDFMFVGSQLLMQHVIFNLLKNALYAIASSKRGTISIWTERGQKFNCLYFKDTAKGIPKKQLARLFEHFHSTTFMGTGIGLSFCKMVMQRFGGDIYCESEEGYYTQFTLTFPIV